MTSRVRASIRRVSNEGPLEYVSIDDDALLDFSDRLARAEFSVHDWRSPVMIDEADYGVETVLDFFFVGNALNFVFDDVATGEPFKTTYDGESWVGAFAMWASLKRAMDEGVDVTDGELLRDLTLSETRDLFRGDSPIPLVERRRDVLTHVGERLCAVADGRFHTAIDETAALRLYDDGDGLVEWLTDRFPKAYRDCRTYRGETVYFDKKAQLAAGMLYGRFHDASMYTIVDIDAMTVFADYLIPALLRAEGVFEYAPELARRVDDGDPIPEGDPMEVELRIATIETADRLLEELNRSREEHVSAVQLDQALWRTGRSRTLTHHLTETATY
jgi:hypothetical protein